MPQRDPQIEAALRSEVGVATSSLKLAEAEFQVAMNNLPTGLPESDGLFRIHKVGERYRSALRSKTTALSRLNAYTIFGEIPSDLPGDSTASKGEKPAASAR